MNQQIVRKRKVDKLVNAAERLAAVQYEAGLRAAEQQREKREKVQKKVNKCWNEFRIACDAVLNDFTEAPAIIMRWSK